MVLEIYVVGRYAADNEFEKAHVFLKIHKEDLFFAVVVIAVVDIILYLHR